MDEIKEYMSTLLDENSPEYKKLYKLIDEYGEKENDRGREDGYWVGRDDYGD